MAVGSDAAWADGCVVRNSGSARTAATAPRRSLRMVDLIRGGNSAPRGVRPTARDARTGGAVTPGGGAPGARARPGAPGILEALPTLEIQTDVPWLWCE